jgi:serine/threonine-protein kinase
VTLEVPPPSSSATTPLGLGEVLAGKYRVDRVIGAGGMGVVLEATHMELDQKVAIKMMREEGLRNAEARARFAREAKAAVRLKSNHVARVIDVGALENGAPYLVMEYLEGSDLGTVLEDRGALAIEEAVAFTLQACEAVAEAHGIGVVHRDLKPRNMFLTTSVDGKPLVKVLDFGISKLLRSNNETADVALTKTTDVMGSPSYMAPEQLKAARHADERSDIWSLGVILFELLTTRLPWEAESTSELCAMVFRDPPRSVRLLRPEVPAELEAVIGRCLAKERADRFPSVVELARALEPFAVELAAGAGERIARVARTSKQPGPLRSDRPSAGGSRVVVSGGTSVSWGETEQMPMRPSAAPKLKSRSGALAVTLAIGGVAAITGVTWTLTHLDKTPAATPAPVLPEDRGAIRPPASAAPPSVSTPDPAPPATGIASATPIGSIPRRAPPGAKAAPAPPPSTTTTTAAPAEPTSPPDPHDISSIRRK